MKFEVLVTDSAERDLEDLYDFIASEDSLESADYVLDQLLKVQDRLRMFPERGTYPKEMLELGIHDFRQVFFKPYRVVYKIENQQVLIYMIVDGRRDMHALMGRRLLGR